MTLPSSFEIYSEDGQYRWRFFGPDGKQMATSSNAFPVQAMVEQELDQLRDAMQQPTVVINRAHESGSRWRPIAPDGTIGQPQPEPPDEPDEGETGPPEVQLCARPDCDISTPHFAH